MGDDLGLFQDVAAVAAARLVEHWEDLRAGTLPVTPGCAPGDTRALLPAQAPEHGEALADILQDTWSTLVPGLVHWQHPGFLGYYPTANSPASVLAEFVAAGLGVQGMMWCTSPAATELEQVVTDWLAKGLGLPSRFWHEGGSGGGVIQDSASSAVLVAVVAALHRASSGHWATDGASGFRLYCTDQANSCVPKAARIAGLGSPVLVPTAPGSARMDPAALARALEADQRAGRTPAIVVATVGTTASCAVDPIAEVGRVCREHGVWLHVDAAYAGTAALCPEFRHLNEGVELADSYDVNAHKWMRTGIACDVLWTADRRAVTDAMSITPSFLRNPATDTGEVVDFRDWQIPLGRPMRALKLWYVMRAHGLEGLRAAVRRDVALAAGLARAIASEPGFKVVAQHLGLVAFRRDHDEDTRILTSRLHHDPRLLCTPATVDGRPVIRAVIGSSYATARTVDECWEIIRGHAREPLTVPAPPVPAPTGTA